MCTTMRLLPLLLAAVFGQLIPAVICQLDGWEDYQLVWEDQFDFLDLTKWQHEITAWGSGNGAFHVYTPDSNNSFVDNGILYIRPSSKTKDTCSTVSLTLLENNIDPRTGEPFGLEFFENGVLNLTEMYGRCDNGDNNGCYRVGGAGMDCEIPPIMSGTLRSRNLFNFTYGRAVIRTMMPVGDWMWPAIWMMPQDGYYGGWPVSGEIDITEIISNEDFVSNDTGEYLGIQKMGTTTHWGPDRDQNRYPLTHDTITNISSPYARNFHILVLDWSENGIRWYVDDELVLSVPDPLIDQNPGWSGYWDFGAPWNPDTTNPWTDNLDPLMAPFDRGFYFIINVAIGGINGYIPDGQINRGGAYNKPWTNEDTQQSGMNKFRFAKDDWYWTWTKEGTDASLQVDYIQVYQRNITNV